MPKLTLAFELRGTPCFASLQGVRSEATNRLKPGTFRLTIQPNDAPKVPTPKLTPAERHFTGSTFADRRKSVQVNGPLTRVDRKSVLGADIHRSTNARSTTASVAKVFELIKHRKIILELVP